MKDTVQYGSTNNRQEIISLLKRYHQAMTGADTSTLEELLDPHYSLVHITGYRQPKEQWYNVIQNREFDYHRIILDESALSISCNGDEAIVKGNGVFDATINGFHSPWRLSFELKIQKRYGEWVIMEALYNSY